MATITAPLAAPGLALSSGLIWQNFVLAIKADATRSTYVSTVQRLSRFIRGDSSVCGLDELVHLIQTDPRVLEQTVINYLNIALRGTTLANKRTALGAIKLFFTMNDVVLNWKKISKYLRADKQTGDDLAYNREQISKLLSVADERMKVAVLLFASTGLRKGALLALKVKDLVKVDQYGLYAVTAYSDDKEARYVTFCSPECAKAIDDYLAYRVRCGDEVTRESPVIRTEFDVENPASIKASRRLTEAGFDHLLKKLLIKAGLRKTVPILEGVRIGSIRHDVKICHGFRKFFATSCRRAKIDPIIKENLMGHKGGQRALELVYDRATQGELVQEYLKAVPELTISEEYVLRRQLEQKQKLSEASIKRAIAEMIENYFEKRSKIFARHDSLTETQFEKMMIELERENPLPDDLKKLL